MWKQEMGMNKKKTNLQCMELFFWFLLDGSRFDKWSKWKNHRNQKETSRRLQKSVNLLQHPIESGGEKLLEDVKKRKRTFWAFRNGPEHSAAQSYRKTVAPKHSPSTRKYLLKERSMSENEKERKKKKKRNKQ